MVTHSCEACGAAFESRRRDARFCSPACRKAAWKGAPLLEPPPTLPGPVERETRRILSGLQVDGADDVARAAVRIAGALDDPATPASALGALSRQLPQTIAFLRAQGGDDL